MGADGYRNCHLICLDAVMSNDSFQLHQPVQADEHSLAAASDMVVLELSEDELIVGSKATGLETIRVIGYSESLAVRLRRRMSPPR
jgi:hypothetical protein